MSETMRTGSCLCGGVAFQVEGAMRHIIKCYCTQCRKTSGNYVAATNCRKDRLTFLNDKTLQWYQSSETMRRGFCSCCGGNVLIDFQERDRYSIPAGVMDQPTGLMTVAEIYKDQEPDYLENTDDAVMCSGAFQYGDDWQAINERVG